MPPKAEADHNLVFLGYCPDDRLLVTLAESVKLSGSPCEPTVKQLKHQLQGSVCIVAVHYGDRAEPVVSYQQGMEAYDG